MNFNTYFGYRESSDSPTPLRQLLYTLGTGHSRRILESLNFEDDVRHTNYPAITFYTKL